jgi:hypothetical protein
MIDGALELGISALKKHPVASKGNTEVYKDDLDISPAHSLLIYAQRPVERR